MTVEAVLRSVVVVGNQRDLQARVIVQGEKTLLCVYLPGASTFSKVFEVRKNSLLETPNVDYLRAER